MKNEMTIGRKIAIGFMIILSLTLAVGIAGYTGLNHILHHMEEDSIIHKIEPFFSDIRVLIYHYMINDYKEGRKNQDRHSADIVSYMRKSISLLETVNFKEKFTKKIFKQIENNTKKYMKHFTDYEDTRKKKIALETMINDKAKLLGKLIKEGKFMVEPMNNLMAFISIASASYFDRNDDGRFKKLVVHK